MMPAIILCYVVTRRKRHRFLSGAPSFLLIALLIVCVLKETGCLLTEEAALPACGWSNSEAILQRELQIARALRRIHYAFVAAAMHVDRVTLHHEDGRIESVDSFKSEFYILAFRDRKLLRHSHIYLFDPGTAFGAHAAVPEMTRSRILHGAVIEP